MTTMRPDPLVDDYLRRLEIATAGLPRARRAELVEEIRQHVDEALGEAHDESSVRNVLERLGTPEEIAAAAGPPAARGRRELAALLVLSLSFVVPVLGYLIGARLVLASHAWDGRDKVRALLIPPLVLIGGGVIVLLGAASVAEGNSFNSGLGPVEIAVLLANAFSGLAAAAYLSARLRAPRR